MKIKNMTRDEKSMLLYIETCCVDAGGLLEGRRMNIKDVEALDKLKKAGLLSQAGRIPFVHIDLGKTHYAELSDMGFALAHELRKERAQAVNRGPYAKRVFDIVSSADT